VGPLERDKHPSPPPSSQVDNSRRFFPPPPPPALPFGGAVTFDRLFFPLQQTIDPRVFTVCECPFSRTVKGLLTSKGLFFPFPFRGVFTPKGFTRSPGRESDKKDAQLPLTLLLFFTIKKKSHFSVEGSNVLPPRM